MSEYSVAHERANVLTHLAGFIFGLVALPLLLRHIATSDRYSNLDLLGATVYGIGFLMVFGFSSLYHYQNEPAKKRLMKIWDHISIYYLIAGTYTPFLVHFAEPDVRETYLWILWGLAAFGTVFKIFFTGKWRLISTGIYLAMGWMIIAAPNSFQSSLPDEQVNWIIFGGLWYTLGVVFYLVEKIPYNHAIWHVFVLGGAVSHFVAVWAIFS